MFQIRFPQSSFKNIDHTVWQWTVLYCSLVIFLYICTPDCAATRLHTIRRDPLKIKLYTARIFDTGKNKYIYIYKNKYHCEFSPRKDQTKEVSLKLFELNFPVSGIWKLFSFSHDLNPYFPHLILNFGLSIPACESSTVDILTGSSLCQKPIQGLSTICF